MDVLKRCKILIGPSCESVFIRDCEDCVISVACKQLRTRDCHRCTIHLYSKTDPVIETSSWLKFAPFNASYPGLTQQFRSANLPADDDHWQKIFDFNKDDEGDLECIPDDDDPIICEMLGEDLLALLDDDTEECDLLLLLQDECLLLDELLDL